MLKFYFQIQSRIPFTTELTATAALIPIAAGTQTSAAVVANIPPVADKPPHAVSLATLNIKSSLLIPPSKSSFPADIISTPPETTAPAIPDFLAALVNALLVRLPPNVFDAIQTVSVDDIPIELIFCVNLISLDATLATSALCYFTVSLVPLM